MPPRELEQILAGIKQRAADQPPPAACRWAAANAAFDACAAANSAPANAAAAHTEYKASSLSPYNAELAIDGWVRRLPWAGLQVMDPRPLGFVPAARSACHRHAHESICVLLSGEGETRLGSPGLPPKAGDLASVPRWLVHQSRHTSAEQELSLLASTAFGLSSALLGDDHRRIPLQDGGAEALPALAVTAAPQP